MLSAFRLLFCNMEVVMSDSELYFEDYRRPDIDEVNGGRLNGVSNFLPVTLIRLGAVSGSPV